MTLDLDVTWPTVVAQLKAEALPNELLIETFKRLRHPPRRWYDAVHSAWHEVTGQIDGDR
jgi:hypothetical protein